MEELLRQLAASMTVEAVAIINQQLRARRMMDLSPEERAKVGIAMREAVARQAASVNADIDDINAKLGNPTGPVTPTA